MSDVPDESDVPAGPDEIDDVGDVEDSDAAFDDDFDDGDGDDDDDDDDDGPRLELTAAEFEALAQVAISELPEDLRKHAEEVLLSIEPYAPEDLLEQMEVPEDEDLFGLYEGPSLAERSVSDAPHLPPRVRLFYEAILDACETEEEVKHEVKVTILHEIGHHFGMDEEQLERLGYG